MSVSREEFESLKKAFEEYVLKTVLKTESIPESKTETKTEEKIKEIKVSKPREKSKYNIFMSETMIKLKKENPMFKKYADENKKIPKDEYQKLFKQAVEEWNKQKQKTI